MFDIRRYLDDWNLENKRLLFSVIFPFAEVTFPPYGQEEENGELLNCAIQRYR